MRSGSNKPAEVSSAAVAPLSRRLSAVLVARVLLFVGASVTVAFVLVPKQGLLGFSASVAWATAILVLATSLLGAWAIRAGRKLEQWALAQLLLDQALWTGIVYLSGGVASGATSLYGVTCLTGGFLLGVSGVWAAALAGGVFFSLLVLLIESGTWTFPADQSVRLHAISAEQVTYYFVINVLVLVLVALLSSYLAERLSRAGGALQAAESRAIHAERLAGMGRLAAGLAHEIRNPLSSIAAAVQILRTSEIGPEDKELCDIVLREAGRLEDLVSDMVDLARPRPPQLAETDVAQVVRDVVELAVRSGRAHGDVGVRRVGADEPILVRADAAQLRQLVWNLVRNAVQASSPGCEVRVILSALGRVTLEVQDDGQGIDEEAQGRLFDVFFTTRSQGTGLGLAVVKRIADDHGFAIKVNSGPGLGAVFLLDLGEPLLPNSVHR